MTDWQTIDDAQTVRHGTVADLKMGSGRIYRAVWEYHGRCCAWWPVHGQARKTPIGLYEPEAFRPVAIGIGRPPLMPRRLVRPRSGDDDGHPPAIALGTP